MRHGAVTMKNPWLDIPLDDYEGHMALPQVAQAQMLAQLFRQTLDRCAPASLAVLGCAGGNGFEAISPAVTRRVVGIDIHPEYVRRARERFGRRLPGIELFVGDALADEIAFSPVQLVFAGLFFEYVDPCAALKRIRQAMLVPGGTLVSVVQLASSAIPEVTPSPYTRLGGLSAVMRLVAPHRLAELAADNDFCPLEDRTVMAGGGKRFRLQSFRLAAGALLPDR
jgi:protein-L-isoaspartate O-methyltransferase